MNQIVYPTLDLYLYDLRDGLGQNQQAIAQNQAYFKAKLPNDLHAHLFKQDRDFEAEYVPLLKKKGIARFVDNSQELEGCYYPVRLGDTYGLLVNTSVKNTSQPHPLFCVKKLQRYLAEKIHHLPPSLGQTWMISAELPPSAKKSPQEIAKACYNNLMPDGNWQQDWCGEGRFQGGYIVELWRYQLRLQELGKNSESESPPKIEEIQDNHHVIIAIYPNAGAAKEAARYNFQEWMRLFSYRAKIMWAYGQSRYLKAQLQQDFVAIQGRLEEIEAASKTRPKLYQIQEMLEKAQGVQSRYGIHLSNFLYQIQTLEVNLENYQKRLISLREKAEGNKGLVLLPTRLTSLKAANELGFLEGFRERVAQKYLRQLKKDYESFAPGMELLDGLMNAIASLRVLVETVQVQGDRHFQNKVAIWGIGLAAGSIAASISSQFPIVVVPTVAANQENDPNEHFLTPYLLELGVTEPWLTPTIATGMTILAAVIFAVLTAIIIRLCQGRSR
ncbi:hypothetical protein [Phormidium sp. CCY1219]|uniref:hypothetical protein n=1 Tax=Phormidium sp. CCY1219 TaxID=2886104 RepID=UPI002D1F9736|nr:hypothetical protein [Phormidium sp. CCY1219]MEB3827583.1 hypothetical protein [Phormidium sp. CCY1219]